MKNVGNCEEGVSPLQYIVYKRERERVRGVPDFFVTLQFLTFTFARYKTGTKKLKGKQKKQQQNLLQAHFAQISSLKYAPVTFVTQNVKEFAVRP